MPWWGVVLGVALFFFKIVCVPVCLCTFVYRYPKRSEEGAESPGTNIAGSCKQPYVVLESEIQFSHKSSMTAKVSIWPWPISKITGAGSEVSWGVGNISSR